MIRVVCTLEVGFRAPACEFRCGVQGHPVLSALHRILAAPGKPREAHPCGLQPISGGNVVPRRQHRGD